MENSERQEAVVFESKRYYRVDEIAMTLAVSKRTVYRMLNDIEKPLQSARIRGSLRVLGCELNKYLEDNKKDPLWE